MRPADEWISQGDVFASVPIPTQKLNKGNLQYGLRTGPALLLTDDCILDKRSNGKPALKRLNFAPLRNMADQNYDPRKVEIIRAGEVNPPDPVYVNLSGFVDAEDEDEEAVALLSETFAIPQAYFDLVPMEDGSDTGDSYRHKISRTRKDTRHCTMERAEKRLLQEKLALFWAGAALDPVCTECWQPCDERAPGRWFHNDAEYDGHLVVLTASLQAILRSS